MLSMVLGGGGGGHRRQLLNGSGSGGAPATMQQWTDLSVACGQIDSSRLLLAIKDLTQQGCYSPALADECTDGWILAAENVCFSAGGMQPLFPSHFSLFPVWCSSLFERLTFSRLIFGSTRGVTQAPTSPPQLRAPSVAHAPPTTT